MRANSPNSFCNIYNVNKDNDNANKVSKMTKNSAMTNTSARSEKDINIESKSNINKIAELENQFLNYKLKIEDLENENQNSNMDKNFQFNKLTNIEEYVKSFDTTDGNANLLKHAVLKLIYASIEDNARVKGNKLYLNNLEQNEDQIVNEETMVEDNDTDHV